MGGKPLAQLYLTCQNVLCAYLQTCSTFEMLQIVSQLAADSNSMRISDMLPDRKCVRSTQGSVLNAKHPLLW